VRGGGLIPLVTPRQLYFAAPRRSAALPVRFAGDDTAMTWSVQISFMVLMIVVVIVLVDEVDGGKATSLFVCRQW
jgi:hypothetical protein